MHRYIAAFSYNHFKIRSQNFSGAILRRASRLYLLPRSLRGQGVRTSPFFSAKSSIFRRRISPPRRKADNFSLWPPRDHEVPSPSRSISAICRAAALNPTPPLPATSTANTVAMVCTLLIYFSSLVDAIRVLEQKSSLRGMADPRHAKGSPLIPAKHSIPHDISGLSASLKKKDI